MMPREPSQSGLHSDERTEWCEPTKALYAEHFEPISNDQQHQIWRLCKTHPSEIADVIEQLTVYGKSYDAIVRILTCGRRDRVLIEIPTPRNLVYAASKLDLRRTMQLFKAKRSSSWTMADPYAAVISTLAWYTAEFGSRIVCRIEEHAANGALVPREILRAYITPKDREGIDLRHADCVQCLNQLGVAVATPWYDGKLVWRSSPPTDAQSIRIESPSDFEQRVGALLTALGLTVEVTKGSWDGGIDCVATDPRPLIGGRIVVQAKRYTGAVPASAVRDLYGTVMSEGAMKGLLITTGTFGPTTLQFAAGKPLELIDGARLHELTALARRKRKDA